MNILKPITTLFSKQAAPIVEARAASPMSAVIQPKAQDRLYELIEREQLPGDVRETLAGALTGDLPRQQLLFQAMIDTWPRLQKNLTEVARSVSSTPWEIQPYSEQGNEATDSAIEKARMVQTAIENMAPRPAWDELSERGLVKSLVHGYYMGHQVCEVFWDRKPEGTMPRSAKIVPPRFYDYPDTGEDRLMFSPDGGFYTGNYEDFPEHHFVIAVNRGHGAHPSIAAPLRALTGYWLAATFGLKWLLQFAQLYGVPFRWAEYEDETVKSKVCNMLENIGSAGWGAFPKGTKLDFVNAGQSADSLPQAMLLEMADKQCDTFILGQTLTTDVGDSGSRALGDIHQEVRAGVMQGINDFIGDIYNHQLIPSIIKLNYGSADELPKYSSKIEAPKDEIGMAQRDQTLISMGMEVGKEWLYERHGVPMPEEGDDDIFSPGGNGAGGDPQTGNSVLSPNETPSEADPDNEDEEVEASMVRAYDPNQKRAEKGSDNGGQWVADNSKGGGEKKSRVSEARSKRYSELEAKFNEGTITDEELGEAHDLVRDAAEKAGYLPHDDFRDAHAAPSGSATDEEVVNDGFDASLDQVARGVHIQPDDYFDPVKGPRYYMYGDKAGLEARDSLFNAFDEIKKDGSTSITVYRAVPNERKGSLIEDNSWVSPSITYAKTHGVSRFGDGEYKIISEDVKSSEIYWDGNDIREWGKDSGKQLFYKNTANNIKSADIFTGTPLAERFNEDDDRITFSHAVQAYDPNQKRAKDGRWTDGAISRGVIDKVERSHIDSYDGQDDYELVAYKGDDIMGYLSYSEHEGDVSISMVETRETHKRKGIATELYKELVKLHGEKAISSSFATKEGSALRKALEKRGIIKKDGTVVKSANATRPTIDQLSDNVLESLTGVTREWLSPVRPHFEKLAAMAMSKQVSDADFIEALEKSQRDIPELFDKLNVEALQTHMNDAIGTAMIAGSVERYEAGEVKAGGWITTDEGNKVFLDNPRKKSLDQGLTDPRKKGDKKPKAGKKPLNKLELERKAQMDKLLKDLREKADRGEVYASESLSDMKERIRKDGASISKKRKGLEKSIEYWKGQRSMVGQELDRPNSIFSIKPEPGEDGADYEERIKKRLAARKDKIAEYNEISDKIAEIKNEESYLGADLIKLPEADRGKALSLNKRASSIAGRRKGVELYESIIHKDLVESNTFKFGGSTTRAHHSRDRNGVSIIRTHRSDDPSVVVHELVHGIEKDDVLKASLDFRAKRTKGESTVRLKKLMPDRNYRPSEITYKDKWVEKGGSHYTGKVYAGGILGGQRATEVLTVGVQRLLKDPLEFMTNDEDHFDFVVKTLQKRK